MTPGRIERILMNKERLYIWSVLDERERRNGSRFMAAMTAVAAFLYWAFFG